MRTANKLVWSKSTDFEVHRNWMAITYQKPVNEWYLEKTSQWTLDYPPLFAWFEYFLSVIAKYFDPKMLEVTNLNYESSQAVFFMRMSVVFSDVIYYIGVNRIFNLSKTQKASIDDPWLRKEVVLAMLLLWNPGLLLVDHIHFQYNGFLSGILFISVADMFQEKYVQGTFWFCILINFKHIYLYLAPAFFIFLLKNYCFKSTDGNVDFRRFSVKHFLALAAIGIVTVLISFGPFIYMGQLKQVLSRLFPVKRGLTHSYWAPNIWALYNFADRVISFLAYQLKFYAYEKLQTCSTRGLVQECDHVILPSVSSIFTLFLAALSFIPVFYITWRKPGSPKVFINSLILCSFGSFLFGYHVHEKAVLMIILPMTITSVFYKEEAQIFAFLSVVGHFSLFPLLHKEGETLLKILLLLLHAVYMFSSLNELHQLKSSLITSLEKLYFCGLIVLQLFHSIFAEILGIEKKLPFLPLMLTSTYCAFGILYAWIKYCYLTLNSTDSDITRKKRKK
ncbi:probable dolichyl pyrophosphate Glc1Man9GlcNAc2 alpha-1,3-glucosyltransferase isoform X2 [Stegodyphus dumicola]|uniref:probable dolichyl pyrophosphate Glc1Man9GlcNAc2 alpha-1,3-glucosyltransferase isoform X2 n=1 Tax=Stegodyphus dumicola TaxID=202533 RepID=UPI0015AD8B81|nr:probable dolichyl pyrophosphate Glc1Man9GlcNAc2 alpha-1,3-glucosyltransferase isoform X2 [Stegodyphus dumicola]